MVSLVKRLANRPLWCLDVVGSKIHPLEDLGKKPTQVIHRNILVFADNFMFYTFTIVSNYFNVTINSYGLYCADIFFSKIPHDIIRANEIYQVFPAKNSGLTMVSSLYRSSNLVFFHLSSPLKKRW